jgi:DNA-binding transcriptional regulator YiaG
MRGKGRDREEAAFDDAPDRLTRFLETHPNRGSMTMPKRYRRITGEDFAKGLEAAHVNAKQFAALYDVPQKRVQKWLDGEARIPHAVALFVGLIAEPQTLEKALIITRYMMDEAQAEKPEQAAAGPAATADRSPLAKAG